MIYGPGTCLFQLNMSNSSLMGKSSSVGRGWTAKEVPLGRRALWRLCESRRSGHGKTARKTWIECLYVFNGVYPTWEAREAWNGWEKWCISDFGGCHVFFSSIFCSFLQFFAGRCRMSNTGIPPLSSNRVIYKCHGSKIIVNQLWAYLYSPYIHTFIYPYIHAYIHL